MTLCVSLCIFVVVKMILEITLLSCGCFSLSVLPVTLR